jgi:hypothetical protein
LNQTVALSIIWEIKMAEKCVLHRQGRFQELHCTYAPRKKDWTGKYLLLYNTEEMECMREIQP